MTEKTTSEGAPNPDIEAKAHREQRVVNKMQALERRGDSLTERIEALEQCAHSQHDEQVRLDERNKMLAARVTLLEKEEASLEEKNKIQICVGEFLRVAPKEEG